MKLMKPVALVNGFLEESRPLEMYPAQTFYVSERRTHSVIYCSAVCERKGPEPLNCPSTAGRLVQSSPTAPTDSYAAV